jgi:alpha-glutamyl/putrescinyl thymine pyrophosphorylase clade 1
MLLNQITPTVVFETYRRFAAERHSIYLKRLRREPPPWTSNDVLKQYKFTNAFRACDRVSQYLLREVIYNPQASSDAEETVFRILLFKFFNRISTWEILKAKFGLPIWKDFDEQAYVRALDEAKAKGTKIFSAAYTHNDLPDSADVSPEKHPRYLRLLSDMMNGGVTAKLQAARSYRDAFLVLNTYPLHSDFIGIQHLTDINYSPVINFNEDDFILPGPGAFGGLQKCFGRKLNKEEAIGVIQQCVVDQTGFFEHFELEPVTLFGRRLHSIDCQNLFCETNKIARVKHPEFNIKPNERIKQKLKPIGPPPAPFFPPKWVLTLSPLTLAP